MKNRQIVQISLLTALASVFVCLVPYAAHAQTSSQATENNQTAQKVNPNSQNTNPADQGLSQTVQAGHYSITLKVLPAESLQGPKPEMVWDDGAKPNTLDGPDPPNRHLAAFITEDGKPVQHANVEISYRTAFDDKAAWTTLPVVRMHEAGHGLETTHFGNNVKLPEDTFEVRVTVDGTGPVVFRFPH